MSTGQTGGPWNSQMTMIKTAARRLIAEHGYRPQPMTDAEKAFCDARIARHMVQHFDVCIVTGIGMALFVAMGVYFRQFGTTISGPAWIQASVILAGAASGVVMWYLGKRDRFWRKLQIGYEFAVVAYFAVCARGDLDVAQTSGQTMAAMLSTTAFFIVPPISLVLSPDMILATRIKGMIYACATFAVMLPYLPDSLPWILMVAVTLCATVAFKGQLINLVLHEALTEYRTLMQMAPASVVRQSGAMCLNPEDIFGIKVRPCCCISSDWRGYQKVALYETPQTIASRLTEYYAMCDALLCFYFPRGNYYADWIADELFVVLYGEPGESEDALVPFAVELAQGLLDGRSRFATRHGYPLGADVGIASGSAMVGMLGVPGFSKASALGDVATTARRRQIDAKHLRTTLGNLDRIVFDAAVARLVPSACPLPNDPAKPEALFYL